MQVKLNLWGIIVLFIEFLDPIRQKAALLMLACCKRLCLDRLVLSHTEAHFILKLTLFLDDGVCYIWKGYQCNWLSLYVNTWDKILQNFWSPVYGVTKMIHVREVHFVWSCISWCYTFFAIFNLFQVAENSLDWSCTFLCVSVRKTQPLLSLFPPGIWCMQVFSSLINMSIGLGL